MEKMTSTKPLFAIVLLYFMISCDDGILVREDCSAVLCVGKPAIGIEILENGTNIFEDGTYDLSDVILTSLNDDTPTITLKSSFDTVDGPILFIQNPDWEAGIFEYNLLVGDQESVGLTAEFSTSDSGGCCGIITMIEEFSIDGLVLERKNGFFTLNLE